MKTDKLLKLIQQKKAMRSGGALPLPRAQNGKASNFLQPNDSKLKEGYNIPSRYPSTELATSIGGEGGEPAYLIPSFKYGHILRNPVDEFYNTGDYVGGPFKTWQEADEWDREIRHPYVEKGQPLPSPLKWWGEGYRQGGSLPKAQVGTSTTPTHELNPNLSDEAKKHFSNPETDGQEWYEGVPSDTKLYRHTLGWREPKHSFINNVPFEYRYSNYGQDEELKYEDCPECYDKLKSGTYFRRAPEHQKAVVPPTPALRPGFMDMRGEWSDVLPTAYLYAQTPEMLEKMGYRSSKKRKKEGGLAKAQEGRSYYDPFTDEVHLAQGDATDDAVKEHELYHRYQNMVKDSFRVPEYYPGPLKKPVIPINIETNPQVADYYNRKGVEIEMFGNDFLNQQPSFMFAPRDLIYNRVIDPQMYDPMLLPAYFEGDYPYPYTIEAEAQLYENAVRDGLPKHARLPNEVRYKKGGLAKAQTGLPAPYLNPATVQAVLAKANQPVTNTLGRVVSTPQSREKERREKIIAKDPSKYSIEDYKQGIKEPGADNSVLSDPIAMAAMLAALPATGAAAAASYPTRFLTNLGDEFIFNTLAGVDPTSIVPTALSFGTKGSLTDKFIKAYDEAGKRAFRVNPTSGIIVDLPFDFNVESKTAKNEIAKKLSEIGIYPRGETVQDITNSVLNPNVNSPIVSMIRNNPDLRRKLAIVTRDLNKHYNLDIDLNNIQTEEQLNNLLNKATDFLNSNSPIASNVRSVFSDNDLRTLRSDLLETINNNQRQSSTRSYQFPNSNITGRKLGNTDFTFQGPSGATMNFEIVPEDKIANHFLFVNRAGSSPNPRQARLDAGNMFRLTTENAPRGFRVTENNMSLDSHPLLWSLGSEGKPFRLLNPYEFYLNSSGFNPDRSLAWDPIITRWTDQALDLGLTESEKNLLLYQVPNNMGRYNPYTDVIYQTMTDNQTMANAINAQNSILNISNTGLQSQFDRGLIPEEMYNANIVKWLADPSNPGAGLSIKPPKIEDYMLDWDIADRQRLLPFQIPNDSRMRHPFFTKLAPTSFLPNPMFSSDPLTREAAAAKNVYRYLLDPAGSIGKDAVLKQAIPIFEKIYRKGGKTRKVKITKRK